MPQLSSAPPAAARALPWETFEEHAKVAYLENAHGSRFFFKSSVSSKSKTAQPTLRIATRVTTHRKTMAELTHHTSKYQSNNSDSLARITRLLRFAMQEVLGPMKPPGSGVMSPRMAPLLGTGSLPTYFPVSPTSATNATSSHDGNTTTNKTKNKKKKNKKSSK